MGYDLTAWEIWQAFNGLAEDHPAPVKAIAERMGLNREVVNMYLNPGTEWDEASEPEGVFDSFGRVPDWAAR